MLRRIPMEIAMAALLLLSAAGFAEDYQDCKLRCVAERDTRNMECPSPDGAAVGSQSRQQCLKNNQTTYEDCFNRCPVPQPPTYSDERIAPPIMGY